ncbi:glycosyltransferase family 4 protein [Cellulomonas xylanilytica]|uniref:Glycosyl transferase n=1 Tax=Cellulomonas xylanilytica TaxID=233583 RepID=A0A510V5V8_9CELL|nr:glycosyltransferase family 4 protein [Cellulomonas xylanilytica]GEK21321.1 glycosyl transferase [Cellulomonas xylanilytica]
MRRLVIAHPSPDLYGSDRQLLRSIEAARSAQWQVLLVLPRTGPLVELARHSGAEVRVVEFPVLRKSLLHPRRLAGLARDALAAVRGAVRLLRTTRPDALYVNTVTIPWWVVAGRLARTPVLVHVHEAESDQHPLVGLALTAPLGLARQVVANSAAAADVLTGSLPSLASRITVVHNGVPAPPAAPTPRARPDGAPWHLVVIGRLSPRKGIDVALDAVALLAGRGYDVTLEVGGTIFPGYEWYESELLARAAEPDLAGRVVLAGYVHPTWDRLAAADVVLVPSRAEPFGNTAVEGLLARRPVVASRVQGLMEVVQDERTGLLVDPGDPVALADAVERLLGDPALRTRLADHGEQDAQARFGAALYDERIAALLGRMVQTGAVHPADG